MNKNTITAIIGLAVVAVMAFFYYQYTVRENTPGENEYRLANEHLEEGNYDEALHTFNDVLSRHPDYKEAYLGKAITLLQMGRFKKASVSFDKAIRLDDNFAQAYANRGILRDRMGKYRKALADYKRALKLKPELAEGPGWIWRFLHNVQEKPPTIADRAYYIHQQLEKPDDERLLRVPEIDSQQRMYKK